MNESLWSPPNNGSMFFLCAVAVVAYVLIGTAVAAIWLLAFGGPYVGQPKQEAKKAIWVLVMFWPLVSAFMFVLGIGWLAFVFPVKVVVWMVQSK